MGNSILIIGNGSSVLNFQIGTEIDKFLTIARVNNYKIEGFEKSVGTQTHIWFNGANQGLKKRMNIPEKVIVFIPPEILKKKGETIHTRIEKRLNLTRDNYKCISFEKMLEFENKTDAVRLTTGTNAICWAMENFDDVTIHGFDFFKESKNHYFDSKLINFAIGTGIKKYGNKHDLGQEIMFVDSLLDQGKIKKLINE